MATTETTRSARTTTSSWDSVVRWVMLAWVGVGGVYFATQFDNLSTSLITLWLAVQAALTVASIALSVRR